MLEFIAQCGLRFEILDAHVRDVGQLKASDPLSYSDLLLWSRRLTRAW